MAEPGDRIDRDDQFKKDPGDKLYPDGVEPYGQEVISPTQVVIKWPSFDLQSKDFGKQATKAYLDYMLRQGPKVFSSKISTDREGFLAVDFGAKVGSKEIWETWDYHGPMVVEVTSQFLDAPFQKAAEGLEEALKACFIAGGYEETSEMMRPFEELLSPLKLTMSHKVNSFDAEPLQVPVDGGDSMIPMEKAGYIEKVLKEKPEIYIYWRGA